MEIRDETPQDMDAIFRLTEVAFKPMPFSNGTEAQIVDALRRAGDLTISLVAVDSGEVVGHIAFSPITIDGRYDGWFGLGPVSVAPNRQRQGIGKLLIRTGLDRLRSLNARGCALIGDPAVYGRIGFASDGRLRYRELESRLVQRIVFRGGAPKGTIQFAPALEA